MVSERFPILRTMPPKKVDLEETLEQLQIDLRKLTSLVVEQRQKQRQEGDHVGLLENTVDAIQQRMAKLSLLERLEQRFLEEDEAKKHLLEIDKGKQHDTAEILPMAMKGGETSATGAVKEPTRYVPPMRQRESGSERSGSTANSSDRLEETPPAKLKPRNANWSFRFLTEKTRKAGCCGSSSTSRSATTQRRNNSVPYGCVSTANLCFGTVGNEIGTLSLTGTNSTTGYSSNTQRPTTPPLVKGCCRLNRRERYKSIVGSSSL